MIIWSHSWVFLVGTLPPCVFEWEVNTSKSYSVRICINDNGSSSPSGGGGGALPLLSAGTKGVPSQGVGTSPDSGAICRVASFARRVLLMRWARMREVNGMEVAAAVLRGGLLGAIRQWGRG